MLIVKITLYIVASKVVVGKATLMISMIFEVETKQDVLLRPD